MEATAVDIGDLIVNTPGALAAVYMFRELITVYREHKAFMEKNNEILLRAALAVGKKQDGDDA